MLIITEEQIRLDNKLKHLRDTSEEAKNLCRALRDYWAGKTTRSQLNKALKKVEYLTAQDIL